MKFLTIGISMDIYAVTLPSPEGNAAEVYLFATNERVYAVWTNCRTPMRTLTTMELFMREHLIGEGHLRPVLVSEVPMAVHQQLRGALEGDRACLATVADEMNLVPTSVGA